MRAAVLLLSIAVLLGGCAAGPTALPQPQEDSCPPATAALEVAAVGDRTDIREITLWAQETVRTLIACPVPGDKASLSGPMAGVLRGRVDVQTYNELRVVFSDSVARILVEVPIDGDGRLEIKMAQDQLGVTWKGRALPFETAEWFGDARALNGFSYEYEGDFHPGPLAFDLAVNTSWNRGLIILAGIGGPEESDERLPRLAARILDANGTVVEHQAAAGIEDSLVITLKPVPQGDYRIEIERNIEPGVLPVILYINVEFDY